MRPREIAFRWSVGVALLLSPDRLLSRELPTTLTCTSNAKADRGFGYTENQWMGSLAGPPDASRPFAVTLKTSKGDSALRDKVFSALDTDNPIIRSITPARGKEAEVAFEFRGAVVSREFGAVFLTWTNDFGNKVWSAAIDLEHRRAVVALMYSGVTYFGTEVETLDCR